MFIIIIITYTNCTVVGLLNNIMCNMQVVYLIRLLDIAYCTVAYTVLHLINIMYNMQIMCVISIHIHIKNYYNTCYNLQLSQYNQLRLLIIYLALFE